MIDSLQKATRSWPASRQDQQISDSYITRQIADNVEFAASAVHRAPRARSVSVIWDREWHQAARLEYLIPDPGGIVTPSGDTCHRLCAGDQRSTPANFRRGARGADFSMARSRCGGDTDSGADAQGQCDRARRDIHRSQHQVRFRTPIPSSRPRMCSTGTQSGP